MGLSRDNHEIYRRRRGRNLLVLALLIGFAVLIYEVTKVKMSEGHMMEGFDHQFRPSLMERTE